MLTSAEEHRRVFPEPLLISFRRCENLRDIPIRAKLRNEGTEGIIIGVVFNMLSLVVK